MIKVLVVDDEKMDRELVKLMLEGNDQFEIIGEADDGQKAIDLARKLEPDIILMDIRMPNKSGLDAVKEIKYLIGKAKIIILTAYDNFRYAKEAIEGKVFAYLLKPIDQDELLDTLAQAARELEEENVKEQKLAQLQSELESNLDYVRSRFLNDLLQACWSDEGIYDHLEERVSLLKLSTPPNTVMVLRLQNKLFTQAKQSYIFYEVSRQEAFSFLKDSLEEYFSGNILFAESFGSNYIVVAIALDDGEKRKDLLHWLMELQNKTLEKNTISFSAGIGSSYQNILEIAKSYEEAMIALTCFDSDESMIVDFKDLDEKANTVSYPNFLEHQLLLAIRAGNLEKSLRLGERILSFFVDKIELDLGKLLVSEIILRVKRLLATAEETRLEAADEQLSMNKLRSEIDNWVKLTVWARRQIQDLVKNVVFKRGTRKYSIVQKAQEYLNTHYAEDLTLENVACFLEMSPSYFSTIFKEVLGVCFSDYLMQIRIDKAKQLLENPLNAISSVAYEVGFNDPAYFSRAFKRIVGISPTLYRSSRGRAAT